MQTHQCDSAVIKLTRNAVIILTKPPTQTKLALLESREFILPLSTPYHVGRVSLKRWLVEWEVFSTKRKRRQENEISKS